MSGFVLAHLYRRQVHGSVRRPSVDGGSRSGDDGSGGGGGSGGGSGGGNDGGENGSGGSQALELHKALEALWNTYASVLASEGVRREQIARVAEDAVGFCMMEVCRTALGFAGARDPARRISDPAKLAAYQEVAVELVRHCLTRRATPETRGGGVRCLFDRLNDTEGLTRALLGYNAAAAELRVSEMLVNATKPKAA